MNNIIENIKAGSTKICNDGKERRCFELAKELAKENEIKTGCKTIVQRILDYTDSYNEQPRYHYSFDIIEIL